MGSVTSQVEGMFERGLSDYKSEFCAIIIIHKSGHGLKENLIKLFPPLYLAPPTHASIVNVSCATMIINVLGEAPTASANRTHSSTPLTKVSSAAGRISCPHTIISSNVPCTSRTLTGSSTSLTLSPAVSLSCRCDASSTRSVGVAITPNHR